jgi:hypothetical protein
LHQFSPIVHDSSEFVRQPDRIFRNLPIDR